MGEGPQEEGDAETQELEGSSYKPRDAEDGQGLMEAREEPQLRLQRDREETHSVSHSACDTPFALAVTAYGSAASHPCPARAPARATSHWTGHNRPPVVSALPPSTRLRTEGRASP